MKETLKYILGYIIGVTAVLILIPFGLYELSKFDYLVGHRILINSTILRVSVSSLVFLAGAYFMIWSNIYLIKIGKGGPVEGFGASISPRTKKLVTSGPYSYSRNPMVFGTFSFYVSMGIFLDSLLCLIVVLLFLSIMIIYLKLSEEKRLIKDFGEEYIDYKKKVSMIFPLKRLK